MRPYDQSPEEVVRDLMGVEYVAEDFGKDFDLDDMVRFMATLDARRSSQ